jgi:hypothetical protein
MAFKGWKNAYNDKVYENGYNHIKPRYGALCRIYFFV